MYQLPESELDIMLIIWKAKEEKISVYNIAQQLSEQKEITAGALHSYLNRLVEKGFLECCKEGKYRYFKPVIAESEYKQEEGKSIVDKLFGGSVSNLVNCLYKKNKLTMKDIEELKDFVNHYSKE
jgi:predicted transcriptional regulator